MLKSRKISLKSVALAVQQHKNKVLDKVGDIKKCNQQWKHPKNSDKEWKKKTKTKKKQKTPEKTMVKSSERFSWKKKPTTTATKQSRSFFLRILSNAKKI